MVQAPLGELKRYGAIAGQQPEAAVAEAIRSRHQQDYDRLLFSTPLQRLADKTQV